MPWFVRSDAASRFALVPRADGTFVTDVWRPMFKLLQAGSSLAGENLDHE
jgi:hypothetical protein